MGVAEARFVFILKPMDTHEIIRETAMPASADALWRWHAAESAFARLQPPWQNMSLAPGSDLTLQNGNRGTITLRQFGVTQDWEAEIFDVLPGTEFSDRQLKGPFQAWKHRHRFLPGATPDKSLLREEITYRLPGDIFTDWLILWQVKSQLRGLFNYRHWLTAGDLARYAEYFSDHPPPKRTVLITGVTGMIGQALRPLFEVLGWEVRGLSRKANLENKVFAWDPEKGEIDPVALAGVDTVIHLAGANIAGGRWTSEHKRLLQESREQPTRFLAEAVATQAPSGAVFVSMSGASCYPFGPETHGEDGPLGDSFLSEIVQRWEQACAPAQQAGWRVVNLRTGMVLSPQGGALKKMLPAFLSGVGGPVGSGRQHWSWIGIHDLVDVIVRTVVDASLVGPVNAVAPHSVSSRDFGKTLGEVIRRPAIAPLPTPVVKLLFGQMGEETLLADNRVRPAKLEAAQFPWRTPDLETCLRSLLGKL